MSFFDTRLGEDLQTALEKRIQDDITNIVEQLVDAVWSRQLLHDQVQEAITALEDHAQFTEALLLGDAAIARNIATFETRRRYCQTLIEVGALHAAEQELTELLDSDEISKRERGEALGLLGRLQKQRYVRTADPSDLEAALESYRAAYEEGTDPVWHGVNLLALIKRSQADGHAVPGELPGASSLAEELLVTVQDKPAHQRFVWDRTTEVEILIALDRIDDAREVTEELLASRRFRPFHLGSLRRQLTEIWCLDETHPVLLALSDQMLQHGHRATFDLPQSPEEFEKIFGAALPIGYNTLLKGLRCAESVCKITDVNGEGWGTGFLVEGSVIHESLGDEPLIATNAHVVSSTPGVGALQPVEAEARFDVLKDAEGGSLQLTGLTEVWSSPPNECDLTLLKFGGNPPETPEPISPAPALPLANEGAFVYVVGHPAGAGLKLSIRGNDLVAYNQQKSKVHYAAPTEPGSSGSPVFTPQWQLMAVHHAGSSKMRRLDAPSGSYEANEGITLEAIRREFGSSLA